MNPESSPESFPDTRSWAERNGFDHWALAVLWLIAAFILFQLTAGVVMAALLVATGAVHSYGGNMLEAIYEHLDLVFIGNSTGQVLFLGLATWFFAGLHTGRFSRRHFLRLNIRSNTLLMTGIAVALIVAVQPAVWFFSWVNAQIPVPQFFEDMQTTQIELIEQLLKGDYILLLTLFHVGVVPAVCEEILYRGYVMRAFEKSWGIIPAILVSGLLFGLYHIRLTTLLPLALLGMILAVVTWTSGSLYPAMVAHLVNNGGSVLVGTYYPESAFAELTPESMPSIGATVLSLFISAYLIYLMYVQYKANTGETDVQRS